MSRKPLKSFVAVSGLVLLAGLALMYWQAGRVEAAPSGGGPVMEVPPELFWERTDPPGTGPARLVIWVKHARRSENTIQNVLAPLDPDPSKAAFQVLEDSLPLVGPGFPCHLDANSNKILRCEVHPAPGDGIIHGILRVTTAEADVVERSVRFFFGASPPVP